MSDSYIKTNGIVKRVRGGGIYTVSVLSHLLHSDGQERRRGISTTGWTIGAGVVRMMRTGGGWVEGDQRPRISGGDEDAESGADIKN